METLYVIPARGGSKGLPGKNVKLLNGKPLVHYSIETALQLTSSNNICVSTDDPTIKSVAEKAGIVIPFLRPRELAADSTPMDAVLRHAVEFYEKQDKHYDTLVLLQPTSPLRSSHDVKGALSLYRMDIDMVISVYETKANPYYVLFEEQEGFLVKSKEGNFETRQSAPKVYQANGAVYVINVAALKAKPMKQFSKIIKFEMSEMNSVDIDTLLDFDYCEFLISRGHRKSQ